MMALLSIFNHLNQFKMQKLIFKKLEKIKL
jgi:hypothetical protein